MTVVSLQHKASQRDLFNTISKPEFKNRLRENIKFISKTLSFKLQKRKMTEILGWSFDVVQNMEKEYIKFLALNKTFMDFNIDIKIIPNRFIDEFWHYHILDTEKYYQDCISIFGKILHHYPYFGMVDEEDKKEWFNTAKLAQRVWKELFNETLYGNLSEEEDSYKLDKEFYKKLSQIYKSSQNTWAMKCSRCRTCRPSNCP